MSLVGTLDDLHVWASVGHNWRTHIEVKVAFILAFSVGLLVHGITKKQSKRYWLYSTAAVAMQLVTNALFAGGGTLDDPTGDGIIAASVRRATNDGPQVALLALPALLFGLVLPILMVRRGSAETLKDSESPSTKA